MEFEEDERLDEDEAHEEFCIDLRTDNEDALPASERNPERKLLLSVR